MKMKQFFFPIFFLYIDGGLDYAVYCSRGNCYSDRYVHSGKKEKERNQNAASVDVQGNALL